MMNASVPESASSPMAPGFAAASGALVGVKSGVSYPVHLPGAAAVPLLGSGAFAAVGSDQIHRLRSLHGLSDGSVDARFECTRRFAGHAHPQLRWAPGTPGASASRRAERLRSGAG